VHKTNERNERWFPISSAADEKSTSPSNAWPVHSRVHGAPVDDFSAVDHGEVLAGGAQHSVRSPSVLNSGLNTSSPHRIYRRNIILPTARRVTPRLRDVCTWLELPLIIGRGLPSERFGFASRLGYVVLQVIFEKISSPLFHFLRRAQRRTINNAEETLNGIVDKEKTNLLRHHTTEIWESYENTRVYSYCLENKSVTVQVPGQLPMNTRAISHSSIRRRATNFSRRENNSILFMPFRREMI